MVGEALYDAARSQIPDDRLSVLASARNKSIALADVNVRDKVEVTVQARLQTQRVPVPHLDDPVRHTSQRVSKLQEGVSGAQSGLASGVLD